MTALPSGLKFTVYVYELCDAARPGGKNGRLLMWDAVHHVQRYSLPEPADAVHAVLHHFSKMKVTDAHVANLAVLSADQSGHQEVQPSMVAASLKQAPGFRFLAGLVLEFDAKNCGVHCGFKKPLCAAYSRMMAGPCPGRVRTRSGSQFLVSPSRVFSVPGIVWNGLKQQLREQPESAPRVMEHLWHVVFGEPAVMP